MRLTPIATNQTQVDYDSGMQVFFSYKTPVAAYIPTKGYVRTSTKWSKTTTRHINKWLDGVNATEIDQGVLDSIRCYF